MRTKTLALSALLGLIGSASLVAQTNVYSLNAVGYINVPIYPGFNLISCPLICSPDNTLATIMPNGGLFGAATSNQYLAWEVWQWVPSAASYNTDFADAPVAGNKKGTVNSGWESGGTIAVTPGSGIWLYNPGAATNLTLVGTVPQNGSPVMTNTIQQGFNIVGSAVPMSGDLFANTNTLLGAVSGGTFNSGDAIYTFEPGSQSYDNGGGAGPVYKASKSDWAGAGSSGNPVTTNITEAFWFFNGGGASETWTENFAINP
jgi:hypothetical protein